jgi:hypothetical protein
MTRIKEKIINLLFIYREKQKQTKGLILKSKD